MTNARGVLQFLLGLLFLAVIVLVLWVAGPNFQLVQRFSSFAASTAK